jgi:hypothetical protein
MRTTLTIDDDVAASLERLRKSRNERLKDLINEALRRGIKDMNARTKPREPFRTRSVALGQVRIGSLDDVNEALAVAESESFK